MSSKLFTPLDLGGVELDNRIVVAPMCQYQAEDGAMTDWHLMHLGHLALSGAGLLIIEATAVELEGRITPWDTALCTDAHEASMDRVLKAVRGWSTMPIAVQLAHAGRKASCRRPWEGRGQLPLDQGGWVTKAPSALPFQEGQRPPVALDEEGIEGIVAAFVASARRAERVGFDVIELHAAHGYLLHSFLSPISNRRTDRWGGSPPNRTRLLRTVLDRVRDAVSVPVGVRISGSDWVEGGWDVEQSVELAVALDEAGCAFLHCSGGGLSPEQQLDVGPGYQVDMARAIRDRVSMPVIAVGLITSPAQAESIVRSGDADAVALARGMLWDPRWPWHAAAELGAQVPTVPSYARSEPHGTKVFR